MYKFLLFYSTSVQCNWIILTYLISAYSSYNKVINVLKTEQQKINDYLNNLQSI